DAGSDPAMVAVADAGAAEAAPEPQAPPECSPSDIPVSPKTSADLLPGVDVALVYAESQLWDPILPASAITRFAFTSADPHGNGSWVEHYKCIDGEWKLSHFIGDTDFIVGLKLHRAKATGD